MTEAELVRIFEQLGLPVLSVDMSGSDKFNFGNFVSIVYLDNMCLKITSDRGQIFVHIKDNVTKEFVDISEVYDAAKDVYRKESWKIEELIKAVADNYSKSTGV